MVKQVIVIRKDLKMRRGKEIAQGAHAAMAWLMRRITKDKLSHDWYVPDIDGGFSDEEWEWVDGNFAKVCLQVDSEQELKELYEKAKAAGLNSNLITDAGLTEFNGVSTITCLAIGPNESEKIDLITSHLKLY